jgi:hypothetical protein
LKANYTYRGRFALDYEGYFSITMATKIESQHFTERDIK